MQTSRDILIQLERIITISHTSLTTAVALAAALTARGVPAPAGGQGWHPMQVKRVVEANRG